MEVMRTELKEEFDAALDRFRKAFDEALEKHRKEKKEKEERERKRKEKERKIENFFSYIQEKLNEREAMIISIESSDNGEEKFVISKKWIGKDLFGRFSCIPKDDEQKYNEVKKDILRNVLQALERSEEPKLQIIEASEGIILETYIDNYWRIYSDNK